MDELAKFGWTEAFQQKWQKLALAGMVPARVIADFGTSLKIAAPAVITAELSGNLSHYASKEHVPKIGDWVAARILPSGKTIIEATIPRQSEIARKVAGKQIVKQAWLRIILAL